MKRILRNTVVLAAAIAAAACAKEIAETPTSEGNIPEGEGITFTAGFAGNDTPSEQGTKVSIDIDEAAGNAKLSFTAGDFVSVYDGKTVARIALKAENINPDGTATFKADVSADAETYYAYVSDRNTLGSYDPAIVYTNVKNANNPNDFAEIAAGRTPHAAFASCGKDGKLSFKNMLTLLKFKVSTSGVSYVEFKGNKDEYVIGMIRGKYETGEVSLVTFNIEANLSKTAKSNVSAAGADCFLALAPAVNYAAGFTITAYDAAGNVVFATKRDKEFTTTAGKIWDLGTLEDHKMTPYELWQAGYDLEIGGKMYNKAEYGAGTLVAEGSASVSEPGVYFITKGAEVTLKEAAFRGSVMFIGNTTGERSSVRVISGCDYYLGSEDASHHVVAFKNVEITNENTGRRIMNVASSAIGRVVLDNCYLGLNEDLLWRQVASQTLDDMTVVDCDILVMNNKDGRGRTLLQTWNGSGYTLGSYTAKNNVVWSDAEARPFYFIDAKYASGIEFASVDMENNTFYNVDSDGKAEWFARGFMTVNTVSGDIVIKNNLAYQSSPVNKGTDGERLCSFFSTKGADIPMESVQTGGNWSWYPQTAFMKGKSVTWWYGAQDGKDTGATLGLKMNGNAIESVTEPFSSADVKTGKFVKTEAFAGIGATRQ